MPALLPEHEERVSALKRYLVLIFPEDSMHTWKTNKRHAKEGRTAVCLSYEVNGVPRITIEVKLKNGTGGCPHIQVQVYYQTYLSPSDLARRRSGVHSHS
jgi:hypothetical protein